MRQVGEKQLLKAALVGWVLGVLMSGSICAMVQLSFVGSVLVGVLCGWVGMGISFWSHEVPEDELTVMSKQTEIEATKSVRGP